MMPGQQSAPQAATTPGVTYINPFASAQGTVGQTVPTIQASMPTAPTAVTEKPFSNYRTPSPISPYMNLYRSGSSFVAVDNYNTLVRPLLEQQIYNQQAQTQMTAMQQATQLQIQTLNQLNDRTNRLYGIPPSGSYMQFQNYYPGYRPAGQ